MFGKQGQRAMALSQEMGRFSDVKRVVIVAPMLARYDAISAAARDTFRILAASGRWDVRVVTQRNDYADVPAAIVSGVADLLINRAYLAADLLIYHFGVFNDLINALVVGNGHARQVVVFHNVTPRRFVPNDQWYIIKESIRQISNLQYADEVWPVSQVNADVAEEHGVDRQRIRVIPLLVDSPALARLSGKQSTPLELLFVGRIVPSKGVLDLVEAVNMARRAIKPPFRLNLVGNLEWSDRAYLDNIKRYISDHRLDEVVRFCGTVDDAERERLYHSAHILIMPSYHEGFCKPVVEGLRSGCIPIGYNAYNLPHIANGFGRMVTTGDVGALATAVGEVMNSLIPAQSAPGERLLPLDRGVTAVNDFEAATADYVESFTYERLTEVTCERVDTLIHESSAHADVSVSGLAANNVTTALDGSIATSIAFGS